MATYTTTDGRRITSTKNKDGTKTKNIVNPDGTKSTEIYNPKTRTTLPKSLPIDPNQATASDLVDTTEANRAATLATPIQSPVPADQIAPAPTVDLPEPTALEATQVNNTSIQGAVDNAKNNLTAVLGSQRTEIQAEIDALQKEQDAALKEGKELTKPFREQLEKKEREKLKVNENFEANQKLTEELDGLLTQSNELINIATGRQVSGKVLNKSLSKTLADVQARAGVIEAVMSARNGQISAANTMIDRTVNAIVADRNDELSYYNTIIGLTDSKLINLSSEKYKIATTERDQAIKDVESAEATADYIKGLMLNPETAQFTADAGVSLTDSVEEIQEKMGVQANIQEAIDMRTSLVDAGYDISPVPVQGGIEMEAGGQKIYATVRAGSELDLRIKDAEAAIAQRKASAAASYASAASSRASAARTETARLIDLATAGDASAVAKLGLTMPDNSVPTADLVAYASDYAATGKLPTASSLPKGVSIGDVAELARSLPKPDGTRVNANTGVTDTSMGQAESEDLTRLHNITNMIDKLEVLDEERSDGFLAGTLGKVFGSNNQAAYLTQRKAIVDEIARMQTGAALTLDEQEFYNDYLPGRLSDTFFLGQNPEDKIDNFKTVMNQKLQDSLATNQLSIYGYSTVEAGDESFTVGEVITNEYGQSGIVQPDGTIVLMDI